jgi:hypothetical protein
METGRASGAVALDRQVCAHPERPMESPRREVALKVGWGMLGGHLLCRH